MCLECKCTNGFSVRHKYGHKSPSTYIEVRGIKLMYFRVQNRRSPWNKRTHLSKQILDELFIHYVDESYLASRSFFEY